MPLKFRKRLGLSMARVRIDLEIGPAELIRAAAEIQRVPTLKLTRDEIERQVRQTLALDGLCQFDWHTRISSGQLPEIIRRLQRLFPDIPAAEWAKWL